MQGVDLILNETIRKDIPGGEWEIAETRPPVRDTAVRETLFSQGNGYLGLRGNFEEPYSGADGGYDGTYINGFYESNPIQYGEKAFGYAQNSQSMLNLPNVRPLLLSLDGDLFDMGAGLVEDYRRSLSMKSGVLERSLTWTSPHGKKARIRFRRLVSFEHRHAAAIRLEVTPVNFDGTVEIRSALESEARNRSGGDDPRVGSSLGRNPWKAVSSAAEKGFACMELTTRNSGLTVCCGIADDPGPEDGCTASAGTADGRLSTAYAFRAAAGKTIRFDKFLCYMDSRGGEDDLRGKVRRELLDLRREGFDALLARQADFLGGFWRAADVAVAGNPELQQGIRYNMFQLLQAAGTDGRSDVSSKGLSGDGYEGHYFWDTETYVLPFFLFTRPEISRSLLEYRYNILDRARARARELGHPQGALFPWRTINGDECSAYYPAGTAQYHIDADIAHAVRLYCEVTGDDAFRRDFGAEILFETARLWADLGYYNPRKGGKFCINCVTGPDEYNVLVNNNCYTNLMAADNLRYAADTAVWMRAEYPQEFRLLCGRIGLKAEEPASWRKAADSMYIPYDEQLGVHPQDDDFLDRQPWDFRHVPKENYPLLLHYHPLVIYRHGVCKQADLVLALYLLGNRFSPEQKKRDYDYYEPLTTHDSSLSTSVFCIMACELGYREKAVDYFERTARLDLDDHNGNTADGVHTANMAGTWLAIVAGFGGMRVQNGALRFAPFLPKGWSGYSFRMAFRGARLEVSVDKEGVTYRLLSGNRVSFRHGSEDVVLAGENAERRFARADS